MTSQDSQHSHYSSDQVSYSLLRNSSIRSFLFDHFKSVEPQTITTLTMAHLTNDRTGRLSYAPLLNFAILVFSIVSFGLAISYAHTTIITPMWPQAVIYMRPRPSNG